jgi:cell division transport system permease protein
LGKMRAAPLQSLMTCFVIAVALALPAALLIAVGNVKALSAHWQGSPRLTVYMQAHLPQEKLVQAGEKFRQMDGVTGVEYVSPEQGLEELRAAGGLSQLADTLEENPLPPVYLLDPEKKDPLALQILGAAVESVAGVDFIQLDLEWVERLHYIVSLAERSVCLLGLFLCLGVFVTISNTIRLAIESRREEIVVIKLVGGTDAFVRRPLLYTGFWYGLVGGALACALLWLASLVLSPVLAGLLSSYQSEFPLQGLGLNVALTLVAGGACLGLAGAWLAVARHLRLIEPG